MNIVYRVEHCYTLKGMYRVMPCDWCVDYDIHVSPSDDSLLWDKWNEIRCDDTSRHWCFGFETLEHVTKWINEERLIKEAIDAGLVIRVFECPPLAYHHGSHQSIFIPSVSRVVDTIEIPAVYQALRGLVS